VDEEALRHFVEDFALELAGAGMPRMAARTFSVLLASEDGSLTAREIAGRLGVSAAAVSGAVRYLERVDMLRRRRLPMERVDRYVVEDETWFHTTATQTAVLTTLVATLEEGLTAVPGDSATAARLDQARDFFAYLIEELPRLVEDWRERRGARTGGGE
jgi:DNA-binding transcriptional regulator GbsR (MarR family)